MSDERLGEWLTEWSRVWEVPELRERVVVRFSKRLRRSLGRCHPRSGKIALHPSLADCPEAMLREVVCHEAAHVAVALRSRRRVKPHGSEWAGLMERAGYRARASIRPEELPEPLRSATRAQVLFRHRCPICRIDRLARRPVRRWRCRRCYEAGLDGRLEISTAPAGGRS